MLARRRLQEQDGHPASVFEDQSEFCNSSICPRRRRNRNEVICIESCFYPTRRIIAVIYFVYLSYFYLKTNPNTCNHWMIMDRRQAVILHIASVLRRPQFHLGRFYCTGPVAGEWSLRRLGCRKCITLGGRRYGRRPLCVLDKIPTLLQSAVTSGGFEQWFCIDVPQSSQL